MHQDGQISHVYVEHKQSEKTVHTVWFQFKLFWGDTSQDSDNSYGVVTRKSV